MMKPKEKAEKKPLILKGWTYNQDGKHLNDLLNDSFLEFYLAKKVKEKC